LSSGPIRGLFQFGPVSGLTDGQLLERFATRRDEGSDLAFAALVERHGPMVLRACRAILRDEHEAMDAFQSTFLVLARKGSTLWVRDSIGPWLHRVACQAAARASRASTRRRALEREAVEARPRRDRREDEDELAEAVQEEIDRLPSRYREAVVLCDLEGRTFEEAARSLGCAIGTVGSRLSRARARLRDRLIRRGLRPESRPAAGAWLGVWTPIPTELQRSTVVAATGFRSFQAVVESAAGFLALGVLRSMTISRFGKVAAILLAMSASSTGMVALVAGAGSVAQAPSKRADDAAADADAPVAEVKPGAFRVVVRERGNVEASANFDMYNLVEGQTTIISLLPEGTRVKKGDVVCELDSAPLKDRLVNQVIAARGAEAQLEKARQAVKLAENALRSHTETLFPDERKVIQFEIELAEEAASQSSRRVQRTRSALGRLSELIRERGGPKSPGDITATLDLEDRLGEAEVAVSRARLGVEAARIKERALISTSETTAERLRAAIESARDVERSRQASHELEVQKEAKLNRQIAYCKVLAPANGILIYANEPERFGTLTRPLAIQEGAVVRERQKLFNIPDLERGMIVNVKIPEAWIDKILPNQAARIKVDAFPNEEFTGVVDSVAPLPDPTSLFSSNVKVYTTWIKIAQRFPGLRPGMTAGVEILVGERAEALVVPVGAVVRYDNADHLAVATAAGGFDWRTVELGLTDGQGVEVKTGLKAGERVAVAPTPLLTEDQKRRIASSPPLSKPRNPTPSPTRAMGKGARMTPEIINKFQAIPPEEMAKIREADGEAREALLKRHGFTAQEIERLRSSRFRPNPPGGDGPP
jgi:RNA polymerase sigma factor (sigma-70 family)